MGPFHFYDFIAVIVFVLLIVLSLNEIVLGELERDLGNHMILEHLLFFSIGALSVIIAERVLRLIIISNDRDAFVDSNLDIHQHSSSRATGKAIQYWKVILRKIFKLNTYPWSWIVIAGSLFFVWHIPPIFDYASTHESVHIMQHLSFVIVGAATFMIIRIFGESFNLFLIFSLIGMMGFSGLILAISDNQIYRVYSIGSHHNAGTYMFISTFALLLVIMPTYLIRRTMYHIKTSRFRGSNT